MYNINIHRYKCTQYILGRRRILLKSYQCSTNFLRFDSRPPHISTFLCSYICMYVCTLYTPKNVNLLYTSCMHTPHTVQVHTISNYLVWDAYYALYFAPVITYIHFFLSFKWISCFPPFLLLFARRFQTENALLFFVMYIFDWILYEPYALARAHCHFQLYRKLVDHYCVEISHEERTAYTHTRTHKIRKIEKQEF